MSIQIDFSALRGKRVCVALSGGGDSVALFHLLKENAAKSGVALSALNVEHGIRGESSLADSAFVSQLCRDAGVPLFFRAYDVPSLAKEWGVGTEDAARRCRYSFFLQVLCEDGADVIATAHHGGDNAESVLFNLFRGSALSGAGGVREFISAENLAERIAPKAYAEHLSSLRGKGVIRPLLGVSKEEILCFLRENGLKWREDESNADTEYTRNYLRLEVLPPIKRAFPQAERRLYEFSRAAREDDEFLYSLTDGYYAEGEECSIDECAPSPVFKRACVRALRHFGVEKDYTYANISDICALVHGENGKSVDLPCGVKAVRDYGKITFYRPERFLPKTENAISYSFSEGEFAFGDRIVTVFYGKKVFSGEEFRVLYLEKKSLPQGCVLRRRQDGDVFTKFGGGTKKLKDFLIEKKIPKRERDLLPVLAKGKEIFAVCGVEISDKVRLPQNAAPQSVITILLRKKGDR